MQDFFEHNKFDNPDYLVVILHGYGANGHNLIDLGKYFDEKLKTIAKFNYIAPNAPEVWEGGFPDCYQWFSLAYSSKILSADSILNENLSNNITSSNKLLNDFIDQQLKNYSLNRNKLILAGFSQGGMMALYNAISNKETAFAGISFSGKLIFPGQNKEENNSKPKLCLIHGKEDNVVPFENYIAAVNNLKKENYSFNSLEIEDLGHSIDKAAADYAINFIKSLIK